MRVLEMEPPPTTPINGQLPGRVLPGHGSGGKENQRWAGLRMLVQSDSMVPEAQRCRMGSVPLLSPAVWEAGSRCSEMKACSSAWLGPTPIPLRPWPWPAGQTHPQSHPSRGTCGNPLSSGHPGSPTSTCVRYQAQRQASWRGASQQVTPRGIRRKAAPSPHPHHWDVGGPGSGAGRRVQSRAHQALGLIGAASCLTTIHLPQAVEAQGRGGRT